MQAVKHDVMPKKVGEAIPPQAQISPLTGYGMFPYYSHPQQPYMVPPPPSSAQPGPPNEHSNGKPQPPPLQVQDYNKMKEPPLDLMTKPAAPPIDGMPPVSMSDKNMPHAGPPPPHMSQAKFMGNFYSYK